LAAKTAAAKKIPSTRRELAAADKEAWRQTTSCNQIQQHLYHAKKTKQQRMTRSLSQPIGPASSV
jgi:hypothetical protein